MRLTVAGATLITGDVVATLLLDFAAALASRGLTTTIELRAYTADGVLGRAMLLLDGRSPMLAIGTDVPLPEPDNSEAVREMSEELVRMLEPASTGSAEIDIRPYFDDFDL